jgi:hypothetical protein
MDAWDREIRTRRKTNMKICRKIIDKAQVVECFELHAGGLGVDSLDCMPLLFPSLDVPVRSGTVINADSLH